MGEGWLFHFEFVGGHAVKEAREPAEGALALENGELALEPVPMLRASAEPPVFDPRVAVPFALDEEGRWILAAFHPDPRHGHVCPFCRDAVTLRQAERTLRKLGHETVARSKVRIHWMHRHRTCAEASSGIRRKGRSRRRHESETRLHKRVKRLIVCEIEAWTRGCREAPLLEYSCSNRQCSNPTKTVSLNPHVVTAAVEHGLSSGHVADVALLDASGDLILGVEVYVTHQVGAEKRAAVEIPWVELDAYQYEPGRWRVRQCFETAELCNDCRTQVESNLVWWSEYKDGPELKRFVAQQMVVRLANLARSRELTEMDQRRIQAEVLREHEIGQPEEVARQRVMEIGKQLALPKPVGYNLHRWYCQGCLDPMLIFSWIGRREGKPPPIPRPSGLERNSERKWVQTCPRCGFEQSIRWRRRAQDGGSDQLALESQVRSCSASSTRPSTSAPSHAAAGRASMR